MEVEIDKSEWQKIKLGDIAFEYSKRINNPSESEYKRFVGSSNIAQWDFKVKSWEPTSSVTSAMKLFEARDYLLVRRSLYASDFRERAPRADFSGVCSGDILTIKENSKFIIDGFLAGVLNSPKLWKFVVANASGSITRRIKWKDLSNFEVYLPSKGQQEDISNLLWSLESVIAEKERVLAELKNSLSIYFENEILKLKSYKAVLNDVLLEIVAGKSPNSESHPASDHQKGVLKVSAVGDGVYVEQENKALINESDFNSKFEVKNGFILVTRANANPSGIGRPCYVRETRSGLMLSDKTLRLIPNKNKITERFLFQTLRTRLYRQYIESVAGGTEAKNISQALLLKAPTLSPPVGMQLKIEKILLDFDFAILKAEASLDANLKLKESLINKVF